MRGEERKVRDIKKLRKERGGSGEEKRGGGGVTAWNPEKSSASGGEWLLDAIVGYHLEFSTYIKPSLLCSLQ